MWSRLAVLAVTVALYAPVAHAPFLYEDFNWTSQTGYAPVWWTFPSRALTMTTLWWQAEPGLDPRPFHLLNLGLHLVNGWLVSVLARRLGLSALASVFAMAVFLWHPLAVQGVAYISARADLLMTLWVLLACWLALDERLPWAAGLAVVAALVLAAVSKELGAVGGVLVVLTLVAGRRLFAAALCAGVGLAALLLAAPRLAAIAFWPAMETTYQNVTGVVRVLGLFVVPWGLSFDPAPPTDAGWVAGAVAVVLAACAVAWLCWRPAPLVTFGIAWALLVLLPRAVVPTGEPVHDHHAYLALVGLSVLAGALVKGPHDVGISRVPQNALSR